MFRLPPVPPPQAAKAERAIKAERKIVVPDLETVPADRAVELASRLGPVTWVRDLLDHNQMDGYVQRWKGV